MIGLDTNILVRILADEDDPAADRARELLLRLEDAGETVWINHVVLCELAWVLRSTKQFTRTQIADLLERVLTTRLLRVPESMLVEEALRLFRASRVDFADALIGLLNRRAGCTTTYTLDRAAVAMPEFSAVV